MRSTAGRRLLYDREVVRWARAEPALERPGPSESGQRSSSSANAATAASDRDGSSVTSRSSSSPSNVSRSRSASAGTRAGSTPSSCRPWPSSAVHGLRSRAWAARQRFDGGVDLLVVLVILLVGVAGVLARLATRPEPDVLRAVAIGNIVTLVVAVAWAVAGLGAGPELRVVLVVVAVALGALAAVQLRAARS